MNVLLATLGSRGDVQPMIALALGLAARKHQVTLAAPTDARATIEAAGIAHVDLGVDAQRFLHEYPDVQHGRGRALFSTKRIMRELLDEQFRVLEPIAPRFDLIVGAGAVSAPSTIAEALRIPYRCLAFGAMAIPSRAHAPYLIPIPGLPAFGNAVLWRATDTMVRALIGDALDEHRRRLGLRTGERLSRTLTPRGKLILAADPELSPPPLDYDPTIVIAGALRAPTHGALPDAIDRFLGAGPAPVYIGFGSMTDQDPESTTRVIIEAVTRAGVRAIISSGWAGLGGTLPSSCIACGEVSHDALFPRTAGVVHHGGAGTTATAARAGVPQLLVPHLLDQFYWADRVRRVGIGPRAVWKRSLNAAHLAAGLTELVSGRHVANARALAPRLGARDAVATTVDALEMAAHAS